MSFNMVNKDEIDFLLSQKKEGNWRVPIDRDKLLDLLIEYYKE